MATDWSLAAVTVVLGPQKVSKWLCKTELSHAAHGWVWPISCAGKEFASWMMITMPLVKWLFSRTVWVLSDTRISLFWILLELNWSRCLASCTNAVVVSSVVGFCLTGPFFPRDSSTSGCVPSVLQRSEDCWCSFFTGRMPLLSLKPAVSKHWRYMVPWQLWHN